jgi:hypothetical protein
MKKITLLFTVLLVVSLMVNSNAQTCLPDGFDFTTQAEIDNFSMNYPGCTTILGDVLIKGEDITNLTGLNSLISIHGMFTIRENPLLQNLDGLEGLQHLSFALLVVKNPELVRLTNLHSLNQDFNELDINGNSKLQSLSGLDSLVKVAYLDIIDNDMLTSFEGLGNLNQIGGYSRISLNNSLINFNGLSNLEEVNGDFYISKNDALQDLSGLTNLKAFRKSFIINENPSLTSLYGLDSLRTIDMLIKIDDNEALTDISALASLDASNLDSIQLTDNKLLATCHIQSICDYIGIAENGIYLHDNAEGCMDRAQIESGCQGSGIEHHINDNVFRVYPNPASDRVTLELLDDQEVTRVEIYDIQGNIAISQHGNMRQMDITGLRTGMYLVKVTTKSFIARQKIFVLH